MNDEIIISAKDAQEIISNISNKDLRHYLAMRWGSSIALDIDCVISHITYKEVESNLHPDIMSNIFRKPCLGEGVPCLVKHSWQKYWKLAYSDGKGDFYEYGSKELSKFPVKWDMWQVLDMNYLPKNK